ncbi:1,2-phenylacetyl-CoA epoxidase subunit PaaD [Thermus filiformis]|jgi:ring-1,2-phenylacetyl-CoA epoxidase subunit PaaD|uniref:Phenylacetate-CoA oxygenase n=1 Tax=Thermus filiformis TaxID=276 RepID=A0A0A2X9S3_THEFI|nr:1,2-phenylacetyl-CoA epoxidase subunit PaaD [Thermus filiformis]KGQ21944.1 phenylacetate-CoA oxygenase [Thermus filiformis]
MVERYWEALKGVKDPEVPVLSVVEMGMVRGLEAEGEKVRVRFRPTFSGCPAQRLIQEEIRRALLEAGAKEVEVVTDLSPWSTEELSPEARAKLQGFGIAPPLPLALAEEALPPCPRCGSPDVVLRNPFGPALCKALYQCRACGEVFEAFKAV